MRVQKKIYLYFKSYTCILNKNLTTTIKKFEGNLDISNLDWRRGERFYSEVDVYMTSVANLVEFLFEIFSTISE